MHSVLVRSDELDGRGRSNDEKQQPV